MVSGTFNKTARDLAQALKEMSGQNTTPYDTQAEVRRIDGNTAWVHIPGGVDETPVQLTTNAKKGDIVQVRVSGGRAWLYGNATAPPTDDTVAKAAQKKADVADEHATNSLTSAMLAQQYAEEAKESADEAKVVTNEIQQYAQTAQLTVTEILEDAVTASGAAEAALIKAEEASDSADAAFYAATSAEWQLGTIEDVVGALEWISTHAIYKWTTDLTPTTGKWYYALTATEETNPKLFDLQSGRYYTRSTGYIYTKVANPVVADIATYYEYYPLTDTYSLTQDVAIDETKTYYTRSSGYIYTAAPMSSTLDPQTTYYSVVATAQTVTENTNPHNSYFYEIESYDKTVQNYIATHLSLDEGGLHLTDGNMMNRMDISATNGVEMWIAGQKIAQYGATTTIGPTNSYHMEITPEQLSFVTGQGTVVAFMNGEFLSIPRVVVVDSMQIGYWMWDGKADPNHLTLRWIGPTGATGATGSTGG